MPRGRLLRRLLSPALAAIGVCVGCEQGVTRTQRAIILEWLGCEDCDAGLRATVAGMGEGAVPILDDPFDTLHGGGRRLVLAARSRATESYRALGAGVPQPVSPTYLDGFVGNVIAAAQVRAALSLGDLAVANTPGALDALRDVMADSQALGYKREVVQTLRSSEARAIAGRAVVDRVVVTPANPALAVGETVRLRGVALDQDSLPVDVSLAWVSTDTAIAAVDPSTGEVRGIAPGQSLIKAVHGATADTGTATVQVSVGVVPPIIRVESGDNLAGTGVILIVTMRRQTGTLAGQVPVTWSVTSGGGTITPQDVVTTPGGVARAFWRLGPAPGTQIARITGPDGAPVSFRANRLQPVGGGWNLRGRVLVNGTGIANATVTRTGASSGSTTSQAGGQFTFSSGVLGNYVVSVSSPSGTTFPAQSASFTSVAGDIIAVEFRGTAPTPVVITTTVLATGQVGAPYSQTLSATGGNGLYAWSVVAGALPSGLSLNPVNGAITGSPNIAGSVTFTVQASSAGMTDTQTLAITVG